MIEANKNRAFESVFSIYTKRLLRKNFGGIHIKGEDNFKNRNENFPTIIFANHSNWWDAVLPFYLSHDVYRVNAYAMMDYKQLKKYRFFRMIGVFSVDRESRTGSYRSFRYAANLLSSPENVLWIYPQGVLLHSDTRPIKFEHGLARLIMEAKNVNAIPMAFSYEYLNEQNPEVFISVLPDFQGKGTADAAQMTKMLEEEIQDGLDEQKKRIMDKDFSGYKTLMQGKKSPGSIMNRGEND